jgi:hypothetical protein
MKKLTMPSEQFERVVDAAFEAAWKEMAYQSGNTIQPSQHIDLRMELSRALDKFVDSPDAIRAE